MKTVLIDKVECGKELGGISGKQVLTLVRNDGLPCIYLSRRTLRFELSAVKKWAQIRPAMRKTKKQIEAETRRREQTKGKKEQGKV